LLVFILKEKRNKRLLEQKISIEHLFEEMRYADESEILNRILELMGQIVDAQTYAFYRLDHIQKQYILKAVRIQRMQIGQVRPSYSGLVPYSTQGFHPPNRLTEEAAGSEEIEWVRVEGEVPLLTLALKNGRGLIRIGPMGNIPSNVYKKLESVLVKLNQYGDWLD
jgi:hypothetical protein